MDPLRNKTRFRSDNFARRRRPPGGVGDGQRWAVVVNLNVGPGYFPAAGYY